MNPDDWMEIVGWLEDRFDRSWTVDQAAAYYTDLKDHAPEDVWDAVYRIYDRGIDRPPSGSVLRHEVVEVVRERMFRARREAAGLPAVTDEDLSWGAWRGRLGYDELTLSDAIAQAHSRLFPNGCSYPSCDIHRNIA